ncbi:unnamed protein product [Onchocerca flexuosa]|uniref:Uncharacterized protein n=1 Tax=Onchocerca flexuosa TaxID=387005 RepID=A0A183H3Y3_9BILA|nr:unnamed protein product [Onchocerca flexuosa]
MFSSRPGLLDTESSGFVGDCRAGQVRCGITLGTGMIDNWCLREIDVERSVTSFSVVLFGSKKMRLRSNRNTEEPYPTVCHLNTTQSRKVDSRGMKRMAPTIRDEKSAKKKVQDLSAPTTSGCSSTAHHHHQQQQPLNSAVNSDNNAQLVKCKSNKSSRGKSDKTQEDNIQKDISSIPDHILVGFLLVVPSAILIRMIA